MIRPVDIDGAFVARRSTEVASVVLDGEAVLYDEWHRCIHVLNPTATVLWFLLDGADPLDELIADMADAYEEDPDVVRTDVLTTTRELGRLGLLEGVVPEVAEPEGAEQVPEEGADAPRFLVDPPSP
jgi:hypothetical protein